LQAGRAEAVDGHSAGFDRKSGAECRDARDVHTLLAFRHGAAQNDVVNFLGVDTGNAGERFFDGKRGKVIGARGAKRAFIGAADRSADGGDDDGFGHSRTSQVENSSLLLVRCCRKSNSQR
jgi:hypothetical protein